MFFASTKRRNTNPVGGVGKSYAALESRRLLALAPLPEMTANVAEYAATVKDAIVRVDDQQRLIVRTTAENSRIDVRLQHGYLQVNRASYRALALQIDPSQYDRIILISGGDDAVRVSGRDLDAQMHPGRLWVSAEVRSPSSGSLAPIEINGSNFERLEVNDAHFGDVGPFIHTSTNRIRMYGSDGVDRLNMSSDNRFAIATSATLNGDGYQFSSNVFGDLYVTGGDGEDFASLAGTRGYASDAFLIGESTTGNDTYIGRDRYSRISNELWDGRFVDFETQRVDLLSGDDRSFIEDSLPANTYYQVDGQDLVGNYRRIINSEVIEVDGGLVSTDTLFRPDNLDATFSESEGEFRFARGDASNGDAAGETDTNDNLIFQGLGQESLPDYFAWRFVSFERLVG